MAVLVTEAGFGPDDWTGEILLARRAEAGEELPEPRRSRSTSRTTAIRPSSRPGSTDWR